MNNAELVTLFTTINKTTNCFDRELKLRQARKEYKKSDFYKNTHYSIHRAYYLFNLNWLNTLSAFVNSPAFEALARGNKAVFAAEIEQLLTSFDYSKLDGIFEYLAQHFEKLVSDNGE